MTKTTEELKRVMYAKLAGWKMYATTTESFEGAFEAYLEALRKDLKTAHEATVELAIQLSEMTAQRDTLRNKLQAFEFANKSAGDLLRDALATVKRQREYIRTLYTSRKARKVVGGTSGQKKAENVPQMKCGAYSKESEDCSRCKGAGFELELPSGSLRAPCSKCGAFVGVFTR